MPKNKNDLILLSLTEDDRDILSEVLDRELASYLEFYRDDLEEIKEIENYTCFRLLKQMNWPLDEEIEIIENAKRRTN
jgi:DNA-binding Lrp family transcriptional regulator